MLRVTCCIAQTLTLLNKLVSLQLPNGKYGEFYILHIQLGHWDYRIVFNRTNKALVIAFKIVNFFIIHPKYKKWKGRFAGYNRPSK